ncbi:MAG TPA: hypothetical protein PLR06_10320 [Cyclobacteriaceae bacterium]|nr:hypothetical protein [Cyclobacteriaceae bacterium]
MIVKLFKGVWFLSLVATLAVLLYVYAGLPEEVEVMGGTNTMTLSRDGLFYATLALLTVFNALTLTFSRLYREKNELFTGWLFGQVACLHLFMIVALQFFNLYNSQENFDYGRLGVIIYTSIGLVVIWFFLWPMYLLYTRFFSKPAI